MLKHVIPLFVCAVLTSVAEAQYSPYSNTSAVTGTGTAEVVHSGTAMRAVVPLTAKADTLREALELISDKGAAAKHQLLSLGADPDSVAIGEPQLDEASEERGFGRSISHGFGSSSDETQKADESVRVRSYATAEWKLTAKGLDLLIESHGLQQKIETTPFNADEAKELTPEEQELAEEEAMFADAEAAQLTKPVVVYVVSVSEEARAELMESAFKDAKHRAERLAAAAGRKLGKLNSVSENTITQDAYEFRQQWGSQSSLIRKVLGNTELIAFGSDPRTLTFSVSLQAGFSLSDPE